MELSWEEIAEQLELNSEGLTRDAVLRRDQVIAETVEKRKRWLRNRLIYQAVASFLDSSEERSLSGQLSVPDLKLYKRLERRWYMAHSRRARGAEAEAPPDPELASELAQHLRDPLRERLADVRHHCGMGESDLSVVASWVTGRARLSQTLLSEVERTRAQARHAFLSCLKLSEDVLGALNEIFDTHRRVRQPRFDLVSLKLLTENLRVLVAKLHKLAWEARATLFGHNGLLDSYRKTKARLSQSEERWQREVHDLERALTRYRINEDEEYRTIVDQFHDCQEQLENRGRVLDHVTSGGGDL